MICINAKTKTRKYPVYMGSGAIKYAPGIICSIFKSAEKILLVTDDNVHRLYSANIKKMLADTGKQSKTVVIENGEGSKNLENTRMLYEEMMAFNMHRNDLAVAFGGGVTGDLAGFAASTFHRGIYLLQFPTSIIAQVDSSIGGKVVVNHGGTKNIIGSFYQPHAIVADYGLLETLDEKEIKNGLAEIIKYGLVFDKKILSGLISIVGRDCSISPVKSIISGPGFDEIISKCIKIKLNVVNIDEFDTEYRNLLNFGHTAGHALEKISRLGNISHGIAVSWGILVAIDISTGTGLLAGDYLKDMVVDLYKKMKIPVKLALDGLPGKQSATDAAAEIYSAMKFDKKFTSARNRFVLLKGLNKPAIVDNINEKIIIEAILKNIAGEKK